MRVTIYSSFLLFVNFGFSGCGKIAKNASSLYDIASDLGTDTFVMYWAQDTEMFRGTCESSKPLLRTYCQHDIVVRKSIDVSHALFGDSNAKHDELARDKTELTNQLRAIDEALRTDPTNPDLSNERGHVVRELLKVTQALAALDQYYDLAKGFLDKIAKDTIVYKINSDSDRYADLRPLIHRLSDIFTDKT